MITEYSGDDLKWHEAEEMDTDRWCSLVTTITVKVVVPDPAESYLVGKVAYFKATTKEAAERRAQEFIEFGGEL